jgi:hypothetical protein
MRVDDGAAASCRNVLHREGSEQGALARPRFPKDQGVQKAVRLANAEPRMAGSVVCFCEVGNIRVHGSMMDLLPAWRTAALLDRLEITLED